MASDTLTLADFEGTFDKLKTAGDVILTTDVITRSDDEFEANTLAEVEPQLRAHPAEYGIISDEGAALLFSLGSKFIVVRFNGRGAPGGQRYTFNTFASALSFLWNVYDRSDLLDADDEE